MGKYRNVWIFLNEVLYEFDDVFSSSIFNTTGYIQMLMKKETQVHTYQ